MPQSTVRIGSPPKRTGPASAGFTLIELLVVVAIIALLAGMLMAAIGLVRDGARSSACISNLRQISLASIAYAGENDGALVPHWGTNPDGSNNPRFFDFLYPYIQMNSGSGSRNQKKNVFVCPVGIPVKTAPEGGWDWLWTYSLNESIHTSYLVSTGWKTIYLSQIKNPSETVDFADATQSISDPAHNSGLALDTYSTWITDNAYYDDSNLWKAAMRSESPDTSLGVIRYRHGGKGYAGQRANIAWVDGHIAPIAHGVLVKSKHFAAELR